MIDHCLQLPLQGTHRLVLNLHLGEVVLAFLAFAIFNESFHRLDSLQVLRDLVAEGLNR